MHIRIEFWAIFWVLREEHLVNLFAYIFIAIVLECLFAETRIFPKLFLSLTLLHDEKIMIKKLSWAVLATILSYCVFSTQLNAQLACPTAIASCDDDGLVITFGTPADATAFAAANPWLFNFNIWANAMAVGNQITYTNASIFPSSAICPTSVESIINDEDVDCSNCPPDFVITTQPISQDLCYGDDVTFSAAASGGTAPLTYQWQRDCPGSFTDMPGETAASLSITGIQSFNRCDYRLVVTDADGCTITSDAATLDASSPTSVTTQPMPLTTCVGEDASFTVVMRSTTVTFQWQSDCSGTFMDIVGATSATYTVSPVQTTDACNYQVVVTNANDCITISNAVGLTVNDSPTIDTQPMSQDLCFGDDATFSATASGGTAPLSYQWQRDCPGTFTDIAGETAASLSISGISSGDRCDYRIVVTDANGCTATSDAATLDASSPTSVTTQPTPVTVCPGDDADFTIVMRSMTVTYQWQSNCSGTFMDIAGATSATYTVSPVQTTDACDYQVVVTNADGCITTSNVAALGIPSVGCVDTSFDCPALLTACTGGSFALNPAEAGGMYGGTAAPFVTNDVLDPISMPIGNYTLTYTVSGATSTVCEFTVVAPQKSSNAGSFGN